MPYQSFSTAYPLTLVGHMFWLGHGKGNTEFIISYINDPLKVWPEALQFHLQARG